MKQCKNGLILLSLLVFIFPLSLNSQTTQQLIDNTERAMGYIPDWARVVYGVNPRTSFRELGATFYEDFFAIYDMFEDVGIDLNSDLHGFYQGNQRMTTNTDFVIVVLGNFEASQIDRLVTQYSSPGYSEGSYQGIEYYNNAFFEDFSDIYHFSVAYVSNDLVLLANREATLRQAINLYLGTQSSTRSVKTNATLIGYIRDVSDSNLFWMAGFMPEHVKRMFDYYARLQAFAFVQNIDAVEMASNWSNNNLSIDMRVVCNSASAANSIKAFLDAFLPNLAVFTGDDPVFAEIIDAVETRVNNNVFHLTINITRTQLLRIRTFVELMAQQNSSQ